MMQTTRQVRKAKVRVGVKAFSHEAKMLLYSLVLPARSVIAPNPVGIKTPQPAGT